MAHHKVESGMTSTLSRVAKASLASMSMYGDKPAGGWEAAPRWLAMLARARRDPILLAAWDRTRLAAASAPGLLTGRCAWSSKRMCSPRRSTASLHLRLVRVLPELDGGRMLHQYRV